MLLYKKKEVVSDTVSTYGCNVMYNKSSSTPRAGERGREREREREIKRQTDRQTEEARHSCWFYRFDNHSSFCVLTQLFSIPTHVRHNPTKTTFLLTSQY